jgi:subtilisin family serine protease
MKRFSIFVFLVACVSVHFFVAQGLTEDEILARHATRVRRRLNTVPHENVLSEIAPLLPVADEDETLVNRDGHNEVIYMDKTCAGDADRARHLFASLLEDEDDCLVANSINAVLNENYDDYFFFLEWVNNAGAPDEDCVNGIEIDMEAYCISRVEFEQIYELDATHRPFCAPQSGPWWNLRQLDDESDFPAAYTGYHYSNFQDEQLNVYVLDEAVNINHDEFSHLTTKQILGGYGQSGNHGTHVSGTIIGKNYGILRDSSIGLYTYGICGSGGCPWSYITAGLNAVIAHLKLTTTTKRGVINMSIGGYCPSCTKYDWYFDEILANGGIVVVAAGNSNTNACNYGPAASNRAITVGSYEEAGPDKRSWFSNYGACVDAWAPGSDIQSSYYSSYGLMSGTSMASPAMTGMVGALLSANDGLTLDEIKEIVKCSHHSHVIPNCQNSATCNGFTMSCGDLYDIAAVKGCTAPTNTLTFGQLVTGTIDPYEKAYYRFSIPSAQPVLFSTCESSYDTYLFVYDINFNLVHYRDDDWTACGLQGNLEIGSLAAGSYWVAVGGYSSHYGTYKLSMSSGALSCGETVTGSIAAYERDYYFVDMRAGPAGRFLEACGSLYDTYLYYYNNDFSTMAAYCDDCNNQGPYCGVQGDLNLPSTPGVFYAAIGGWSSSSGTYTLSLNCPSGAHAVEGRNTDDNTEGEVGADGEGDGDDDVIAIQMRISTASAVAVVALFVIGLASLALLSYFCCNSRRVRKVPYASIATIDTDSSTMDAL